MYCKALCPLWAFYVWSIDPQMGEAGLNAMFGVVTLASASPSHSFFPTCPVIDFHPSVGLKLFSGAGAMT